MRASLAADGAISAEYTKPADYHPTDKVKFDNAGLGITAVGASARCRTCGYRVGVDVGRASAAMAPLFFFIALTASGVLRDPATLVSLLIICLILTFSLY